MDNCLSDNPPLPINVGVTGHRDIPPQTIPALEIRVESCLIELQKQYPYSPLIVLSSLAEGADRLCAWAALKTGCQLHVPLPMVREEYEKDFDELSRSDFEALLSRADDVFVVEAIEPPPTGDIPRGYYYRQAGLYVAGQAHLLLALWDGTEILHPEGGGTYETIGFMRQKNAVIYHIPTPRLSNPDAPLPAIGAQSLYDEHLAAIDEYNRKGNKKMKYTAAYVKHYFGNYLQEDGLALGKLGDDLDKFLQRETKEKAFAVYTAFFDCFRIHLEGGSFIDLLDALRAYEEHSAVLLEKQRDHLIHSVNVFVLGLSIYAQSAAFRKTFEEARGEPYDGAQTSPAAEFLYRWGLAALLHDIGYPIEIIHNQFQSFISFIGNTDGKKDADPFLDYFHFEHFDSISEILFKSAFAKKFKDSLPAGVKPDPLKPTHLIAYNFHATLGVPYRTMQDAMTNFLPSMQKKGFVDHGFYSAIILLKWYGYLIQRSGLPADMLYYPILDAAGAIFLHNYYRNGLMNPPFSLGALGMASHPIGFLLILCDELQEWNRTAYGSKDKQKVLAEASEIEIRDDFLRLHYLTSKGVMAESFGAEKTAFLQHVLILSDLFPQGVMITQTTSSQLYLDWLMKNDKVLARPLLSSLEAMAKLIHENYNKKRVANGQTVEHPTWEGMPDTLKYSNIRQARSNYEKLRMCGLMVSNQLIPDADEVTSFTPEQIEMLAREEHDEWVSERLDNGWTHGPRDAEKKTSPYLVPYTALPDDIKEYDRDAVRNIFPILLEMGLYVYNIGHNA
jgi:hypothetical protein